MYTKILMTALIMPCFWAQADTDTVVNCPSALGKSTAIIHALLVDLCARRADRPVSLPNQNR
jgi:hypothetical protein